VKPWPVNLVAIKVRRLPLIKRRHRRWLREQVADVFGAPDVADVAGPGDGFDTLFD